MEKDAPHPDPLPPGEVAENAYQILILPGEPKAHDR
jgi:hypothetical protein